LDGTFLFRRVLVRWNFRYISFRLYFWHWRQISGSCFLGSPFIASPFLFDGDQLLGNAKRSLSKRSQTECSAEEKQTAPGMIRRRNRSQVALGPVFVVSVCAARPE
jgi:hypothetical protein